MIQDERQTETFSVDRKANLEAMIGKYADITPSDEFVLIKQAEIDDEERKLRS